MKRSLLDLLRAAGRQVERSFATLLALALVGLFLFGMPQAANVLWQWPRPGEGPLWLVLGFYVFLVGVSALDVWLLVGCVPRSGEAGRGVRLLSAAGRRVARIVGVGRFALVAGLVAVGVGVLAAVGPRSGLDRSTIGAFAYLTIAYGLWSACVRGEGERVGYAGDTLGRALTAVALTLTVGEVLWAAIDTFPGALSKRNYTIWALTELAFLAVLFARVVDALQRRWRRSPLRLVALVAVVVGLGLSGHADIGVPSARGPSDAGPSGPARERRAVDLAWLDALELRLQRLPSDAPVVLVSASGGGSRAALFTALVLESLARKEVAGAGEGVTIADHILAISSVSGGSLATAWYATRPVDALVDAPLETTATELAARMREIAKEAAARMGGDDGASARVHALAETCRALEAAVAAGTQQPDLPVPFFSAYADAMSADFMAPVLRGTLLPGVDRARSLVRTWDRAFGWDAFDSDTPYDPTRPLVLLNAALSEQGRTYAFGWPRPPAELCAPDLRTISQDDPGFSVTLSEMVRLSAGFPWLAPIARVRPAGATRVLHVVDGGIVDNTGMETLAALLRGVFARADWGESPEDEVTVRATRIVDTIRARGLVVVEIDSGAKKRMPGLGARLLPNLLEPVDALQISIDNNALRARDRALNDIVRLYLAKKRPGQILAKLPLSVRFSCDHFEDVMTAWALGPRDKAAVWATFLFEAEWVLPELERALTLWRPAPPIGARAPVLTSPDELFGRRPIDPASVQGQLDAADAARMSVRRLLGDH